MASCRYSVIFAALLLSCLQCHCCVKYLSNVPAQRDFLEVKREYYQNCFIHCQRATSSYSPVGPWVCLFMFLMEWFVFMFVYVLFYLGQLSHFPSWFGAGVTHLNEPPSSFLLPSHYCGLGAGSIPLRAIVNEKQCETRELFMSLVIHYWIGDVQDFQDACIFQNVN